MYLDDALVKRPFYNEIRCKKNLCTKVGILMSSAIRISLLRRACKHVIDDDNSVHSVIVDESQSKPSTSTQQLVVVAGAQDIASVSQSAQKYLADTHSGSRHACVPVYGRLRRRLALLNSFRVRGPRTASAPRSASMRLPRNIKRSGARTG